MRTESSSIELLSFPQFEGRVAWVGPAAAGLGAAALEQAIVPALRGRESVGAGATGGSSERPRETGSRPQREGAGRGILHVSATVFLRRRRRAEALAALGGAALELPFETLREHIERRFREIAPERALVSEVERRVLLERAAEEEAGPGSRPPWPGLIERVGRLAAELGRAGVGEAAALEARLAAAGCLGARERRLAAVLRRYRALLEERGHADEASARAAVAGAPAEPRDLLVLEGFLHLDPEERRVVAGLIRGARRVLALIEDEGEPAPGPLAASLLSFLRSEGLAVERRAAPTGSEGPGGTLARALASAAPAPGVASAAVAPPPAPLVRLLRAESPAAEASAVARLIREIAHRDAAARADLSRVVVAVPRLEAFAPLVRETFPRAGVPFALLRAEPLARTAAARVLVEWIDAVLERYDRAALSRALLAPGVGFRGRDGRRLDMARLDRIAREAGIAGPLGREALLARLGERREELRARAAPAPGEAEGGSGAVPSAAALARDRLDLAALEEGVPVLEEALLALAALEGPAPAAETERRLLGLLLRFEFVERALEGRGRAEAEREAAALRAVAGVLRDLSRGLGPDSLPLERYRATLRAALAGAPVAPARRDLRGRAVVAAIEDCRGLAARHVIVAGLDARFPSGRGADLFLGEEARRALGLAGADERRAEAAAALAAALALGRDSATLVYAARGEAHEVACSPFVLEIAQGVPGGLPVEAAPPPLPDVSAPAGASARALAVARSREAAAPGPFEGRLEGAALERLRARLFAQDGTARVSPSDLETYALCPFRAFAGRILGVAPLPDAEEDRSARELGERLHDALRRFYEGFARGTGEGWLLEARRRLLRVAGAALRVPGKDAFWEARVDRLLAGLDPARDAEDGPPGPLKAFLERESRGHAPEGALAPALREAGFEIALAAGGASGGSRRMVVRGVIDRVDRAPEGGAFVVYDYKSGKRPPDLRDVVEGRRFQLPLYILGARSLLGPGARPAGAAYLPLADARDVEPRWLAARGAAPGGRGNAGLVDDLDEALARVPLAIGAVLDGMAGGLFHPGDLPADRKGCIYCDFRRACRVDEERMARAAADPAAPFFRPLPLAAPGARGGPRRGGRRG